MASPATMAHKVFIAAFAIILTVGASAQTVAQTGADGLTKDTQFWSDNKIIKPVNNRVNLILFGTMRVGRDLTRPVDERGGAGGSIKLTRFLTITPHWLYVVRQLTPTRKEIEHRLIFAATFQFSAGKFVFTERNQPERRLRIGGEDFTVYRNRLQIDHPAKLGSFDFRVFVADEVWYDFRQSAWVLNRISAGIIKKFSTQLTAHFFYLLQNVRRARPGNVHVIGAYCYIYL
jgi:Protein of unknown function (DUF2490)